MCREGGTTAGHPQQIHSSPRQDPSSGHEVYHMSPSPPDIAMNLLCCSLHNDLVAQRALNRRLLAEARRFKAKVASIAE